MDFPKRAVVWITVKMDGTVWVVPEEAFLAKGGTLTWIVESQQGDVVRIEFEEKKGKKGPLKALENEERGKYGFSGPARKETGEVDAGPYWRARYWKYTLTLERGNKTVKEIDPGIWIK